MAYPAKLIERARTEWSVTKLPAGIDQETFTVSQHIGPAHRKNPIRQ